VFFSAYGKFFRCGHVENLCFDANGKFAEGGSLITFRIVCLTIAYGKYFRCGHGANERFDANGKFAEGYLKRIVFCRYDIHGQAMDISVFSVHSVL
jgi:hypothetical protein